MTKGMPFRSSWASLSPRIGCCLIKAALPGGCPGGAALPFDLPFTIVAQFDRSRLPHEVPDWVDPTQEAFFITINCQPRGRNQLANVTAWTAILETLEFREARGDWKWRVVLAMPDHLHGIVVFPERFFMERCVADWKRWLATQHSIRWQDGFFDHRLRSVESAVEKADYIRMNPVRAGLVGQVGDWRYVRDGRSDGRSDGRPDGGVS